MKRLIDSMNRGINNKSVALIIISFIWALVITSCISALTPDIDENLRDPSYMEVLRFISFNHIDENEYTDNYTCVNFTNDLMTDAKASGYKSYFIIVDHGDITHAIIGFNTTDYGMVYFEPQSDQELSPDSLVILETLEQFKKIIWF